MEVMDYSHEWFNIVDSLSQFLKLAVVFVVIFITAILIAQRIEKPEIRIGMSVWYEDQIFEVLGFAASTDNHGVPLVEIAWNNYQVSPTGYLAVPRAELKVVK